MVIHIKDDPDMSDMMNKAITNLMTAIFNDYATSMKCRSDDTEDRKAIRERMVNEFRESLSFSEGKKYIRIIKDNSVWGFVVNINDDKKFRYGDILKAAGWSTPARNVPRGNVFEEYSIAWTGPNYAR